MPGSILNMLRALSHSFFTTLVPGGYDPSFIDEETEA